MLASLPRLQPNSDLFEFGRSVKWPKSETSDFGWSDRVGACIRDFAQDAPSPTLPRKRERERTEFAA